MKILRDYFDHPVRLTDERLKHIRDRPEMIGLEGFIERTLREPRLVIRSRIDLSAVLFYSQVHGTMVGDKWLCVIVKYPQSDAFVLTAYLTDKPKRGEQLWPSK